MPSQNYLPRQPLFTSFLLGWLPLANGIQTLMIIKCQFLTIEMEGQQLPKATMNSFIKKHTGLPGSPEFVTRILSLSKEYIVRLADRSNEICELNNKKTINAEHLQTALEKMGLVHHIDQLKKLGSDIKELNELKREASKRLQENIEREKLQERQKRQENAEEEPEKKQVVVRERFVELEEKPIHPIEDEDYEAIEQQ